MRSSRSLGLSVALALALAGCDSGSGDTDAGTGGMDSGRTDGGGGGDTDGGGGDTDGGGTDSGMMMMVDSGTDSGMTMTTDGCELTTYPTLGLENILTAGGATFRSPMFVAQPPGSTDLYVVERRGTIQVVRGGVIDHAFLDITSLIGAAPTGGDEQGLHSIAFHPDYATNGRFFVMYTPNTPSDGPNANVIAEGRRAAGMTDVADATVTTILSIPDTRWNHNGGLVMFGPDGYLYIGTGDGGGGGDPDNNGQDVNELLGKMLRIDVDTTGGGRMYGIPAGNPFVGMAGHREEILHYGLRNPWRFSFDRTTDRLFIGDVGQDAIEEIDIVAPAASGLNFGWDRFEGSSERGSGAMLVGTHTPPQIELRHSGDDVCSITGGYVYRGSAIPALNGAYLFTDYCNATVWATRYCDGADRPLTEIGSLTDQAPGTVSFGQDSAGELYVVWLGEPGGAASSGVARIVAR